MDELVSVVVPVYNADEYLEECLDSVTQQSYKNLEIILIDDGSTDRSSEICDHYASIDSRIKVEHTENHGCSAARNRGVKMSGGGICYSLMQMMSLL